MCVDQLDKLLPLLSLLIAKALVAAQNTSLYDGCM